MRSEGAAQGYGNAFASAQNTSFSNQPAANSARQPIPARPRSSATLANEAGMFRPLLNCQRAGPRTWRRLIDKYTYVPYPCQGQLARFVDSQPAIERFVHPGVERRNKRSAGAPKSVTGGPFLSLTHKHLRISENQKNLLAMRWRRCRVSALRNASPRMTCVVRTVPQLSRSDHVFRWLFLHGKGELPCALRSWRGCFARSQVVLANQALMASSVSMRCAFIPWKNGICWPSIWLSRTSRSRKPMSRPARADGYAGSTTVGSPGRQLHDAGGDGPTRVKIIRPWKGC